MILLLVKYEPTWKTGWGFPAGAVAALILLLVECGPTWRSGWGFPAGAKAPPRKGGPEDLSNQRRTVRCVHQGSSLLREVHKFPSTL